MPHDCARRAVLTLAALICAGCASTRPVGLGDLDLEAASPPAAGWSGMVAADPSARVDGPWWSVYDDAGLDRILREMLAQNHSLQAVAARVDAADARARIAGADRLPSLGASFDPSRRKQNFIGLPVPGGDGVISSTSTSMSLTATSAWEIDLWGRIRATTIAAVADREAVIADLAAARLSLTGQTTRAWFGLVEARQQLDLARAAVRSYARSVDWVRTRYERGLRSSLDLRLALSSLATARANATLREQALQDATRSLETVLGRYPAAALRAADSLVAVPPVVPPGLPAELLFRRPDLVAAERRVRAQDARLAAAFRAQFPRLTLTGSGGTSSNELKDLLDSDFSVWTVAAGLVQPLFQGGRLRAGVQLAGAQLEESAAGLAQSMLDAYADVERALAAQAFLASRVDDLGEAARQATLALQLAESRYRSGLESYVTVLESQRRSLDAESRLLQVRRQRLDAHVDLVMALGGGFALDVDGKSPSADVAWNRDAREVEVP